MTRSTTKAIGAIKRIAPSTSSFSWINVNPDMTPRNRATNAITPIAGGMGLVFLMSLISEDSHICTSLPTDGPYPLIVYHNGSIEAREHIGYRGSPTIRTLSYPSDKTSVKSMPSETLSTATALPKGGLRTLSRSGPAVRIRAPAHIPHAHLPPKRIHGGSAFHQTDVCRRYPEDHRRIREEAPSEFVPLCQVLGVA